MSAAGELRERGLETLRYAGTEDTADRSGVALMVQIAQVYMLASISAALDVPELLTAAEAAEILRLTEDTVHRYARQGKVPVVMIAGQRRFPRASIFTLARGGDPA